jgi:hypothetical protein
VYRDGLGALPENGTLSSAKWFAECSFLGTRQKSSLSSAKKTLGKDLFAECFFTHSAKKDFAECFFKHSAKTNFKSKFEAVN